MVIISGLKKDKCSYAVDKNQITLRFVGFMSQFSVFSGLTVRAESDE